ncbi:APC family permease [Actinoallomurus rhizosphaericola]|uniref:APC family permease n=1 Tax=Actinoallomurus rhizosphaericola TaxID=2952536 RepID=UPI00209129D3|nr:APC family permease [Actinoallomurus rhizosphaericola]MCO5993837.1 APC family permease [Actinoallomurus rhizosphaericola]
MSETSPAPEDRTTLQRNAVGLLGAVIMSAALMGPAVSVYFNPQLVAGFAGAATPLVMVISMVGVLITASGIMQMARELPSAGAFYTYVSRGIGARSGFVTGGLMFVAYALLVPAELALIGVYTHDLLASYGVHVHWALISLAFTVLMLVLSLRGIRGSLRTALTLFSAEVLVITVLSVIVLAKGGAHGLSLAPLNPASSPRGPSGLALGMVYGVLSFVGFEAATTLGEEVREPRHNVPWGIALSTLFVGVIYLFCTYSEMIGFGTGSASRLAADQAPFNTLAATYAPWMKLLIGLAGISSIFAVVMNSNNGIVRIIFAMGREGMLPRRLAHVDPKHRSPNRAIWTVAVFATLVTFVVGFATGPFNAYAYLGALLTLAIVPVYMLTNIACVRFFLRERREHFNVVRHAVLPVLGILLMLIPIYGSVWPIPKAPYNLFPYLIIAFIGATALIAVWLGRARPDRLTRAGAVLATGDTDAPEVVAS